MWLSFLCASVYRVCYSYAIVLNNNISISRFYYHNSNYTYSHSRSICYIADLTAATTLINHFIHKNNDNNNNNDNQSNESTFHQLLTTAAGAQRNFSSSDYNNKDRLEALHLLQGICNRLHELDIVQNTQH